MKKSESDAVKISAKYFMRLKKKDLVKEVRAYRQGTM